MFFSQNVYTVYYKVLMCEMCGKDERILVVANTLAYIALVSRVAYPHQFVRTFNADHFSLSGCLNVGLPFS